MTCSMRKLDLLWPKHRVGLVGEFLRVHSGKLRFNHNTLIFYERPCVIVYQSQSDSPASLRQNIPH